MLEEVLPIVVCGMKLHILDLAQTDSARYPRRVQCLLLKRIVGRAIARDVRGLCQGALIAASESLSIR